LPKVCDGTSNNLSEELPNLQLEVHVDPPLAFTTSLLRVDLEIAESKEKDFGSHL